MAVPTLSLSPDTGAIDLESLFDPSNPFLVTIPIEDLVLVGGAESSPGVKGIGQFTLLVDGQVYSIPLSYRRRLRAKRGGRVRWRTTAGDSGSFRFYAQAPAVF